MPPGPPLPPHRFYYLHNFQRALDWVQTRHGDLLDVEEQQFLARFRALPQDARALLVRMVMRRGPWFRASKLAYEEIPGTEEAAAPLLALGWLCARQDLGLSELFALHTKRELLQILQPAPLHPAMRKADMLAALVAGQPAWRAAVWGVYGGDEPTVRATQALAAQDGGAAPPVRAWSRRSMAQCLGRYAALGWTGIVPKACQQTTVVVPVNLAPWLWGWPHLMQQRLRAAGSAIVLLGPYEAGDVGSAGIDTLEQLAQVPGGFDGHVWTNRIEVIGPALRR